MVIRKQSSRKKSNKAPVTKVDKTLQNKAENTTEAIGDNFPIVGIGASAGGLAAFESFFSGMPAEIDPGMAFILVQHLAPDHTSILSELIRRYTRMTVYDVEDGMVVKPNCAYIIPPARDMAFMDGALQLLEPSAPRGQRLPIDFFFRSLALDQHERAIGIILSGTGSDGTLGVRAIKGEGGIVMVQDPDSTDYDGMPRNAIATGLVDFELLPEEMPRQLIAYTNQALARHIRLDQNPTIKVENVLRKIFILLRDGTGHDFSHYKKNTINRRIDRRMAVHQKKTIEDYLKYLQQTPSEIEALFRDLLIGVTNFFRDPEAFRALEEQIIPKIFAGKPAGSTIRVWTTGCSTGEEAYSLAILLQEHIESLKQSYTVQVFATDIDSQAITTARAGIYPASIATDLTPERLARFFTQEPGGEAYRIQKAIRDMLVFSEQDVIKDPPYSKLDLISCRNLLIYIGGVLQKKIIPLFHYALNPGGVLFLGTSETIGEFGQLFSAIDLKAKLYRKVEHQRGHSRETLINAFPPLTAMAKASRRVTELKPGPDKLPLSDLTEQAILEQVAPVAILVNKKGDTLFIHGRTGRYLELPSGDPGTSIFKMTREGLGPTLSSAMQKAVMHGKIVRYEGLRVKTNGDFTSVNLTIHPVSPSSGTTLAEPLYLIIFEDAAAFNQEQIQSYQEESSGQTALSADVTAETVIKKLRQELRIKEEYLQNTVEELDTSNEELKSSNEEMQSINEELQSTNEELETSKEELQSVNEELATVNSELQTKVADLTVANNDMNNLLAGTGIATVFVDLEQRIMRFTPSATKIINLIQSDQGRPVGHVVSNLIDYNNLVEDIQNVLDTLIPKDIDVQTVEDKWYRMRIQPYRTLMNVIEGAVITFVDITDTKKSQEALAKMNVWRHHAQIVRNSRDCLTVRSLDGAILAWNPAAERMYGWSETEALTMNAQDFIPEKLRDKSMAREKQLSKAETLKPYTSQRICKNGEVVSATIISSALVDETGKMFAIATIERIIEKKD